jgi:hypothetical protein
MRVTVVFRLMLLRVIDMIGLTHYRNVWCNHERLMKWPKWWNAYEIATFGARMALTRAQLDGFPHVTSIGRLQRVFSPRRI